MRECNISNLAELSCDIASALWSYTICTI